MTLADTIREISREHLKGGGLIMGQNLDAVQNVCNTVPIETNHPGIVVMPTTETAGAGIAIGAALSGRRVIHVIRFQSFLWLQSSPIVNYAAKARELWGYDCPLWIRAVAFEDYGSGPVHTNCVHSPFMHVSGLKVIAPMTCEEYIRHWELFQERKDPVLVSEHRSSYTNMSPLFDEGAVAKSGDGLVLIGISAARLVLGDAADSLRAGGIQTSTVHLDMLKPFTNTMRDYCADRLREAGRGLVIDSAPVICGAAEHIAYELMKNTGLPVRALGMEDRSSGIAPRLQNGTPSAERIVEAAKASLGR